MSFIHTVLLWFSSWSHLWVVLVMSAIAIAGICIMCENRLKIGLTILICGFLVPVAYDASSEHVQDHNVFYTHLESQGFQANKYVTIRNNDNSVGYVCGELKKYSICENGDKYILTLETGDNQKQTIQLDEETVYWVNKIIMVSGDKNKNIK